MRAATATPKPVRIDRSSHRKRRRHRSRPTSPGRAGGQRLGGRSEHAARRQTLSPRPAGHLPAAVRGLAAEHADTARPLRRHGRLLRRHVHAERGNPRREERRSLEPGYPRGPSGRRRRRRARVHGRAHLARLSLPHRHDDRGAGSAAAAPAAAVRRRREQPAHPAVPADPGDGPRRDRLQRPPGLAT